MVPTKIHHVPPANSVRTIVFENQTLTKTSRQESKKKVEFVFDAELTQICNKWANITGA